MTKRYIIKSEKLFFYDTTILNNFAMTKNEDRFNQFVDSIKKQKLNPHNPKSISSPGMLLEVLGYGKFKESIYNYSELEKDVAQLVRDNSHYKKTTDQILNLIREKLSKSPIKHMDMQKELQLREKHNNSWFLETSNNIFKENLKGSYSAEAIIDHLSLEILQDFNYVELLGENLGGNFVKAMGDYFYESMRLPNKNFSYARASLKYLNKIYPNAGVRPVKNFYKSGQDLLDGELLHFSIFGLKGYGPAKKITVFTCESPQLTKDRIYSYYLFLKATHENFCFNRNKRFKFLKTNPGKIIHFCRNSGKLLRVQSVKTIIKDLNDFFLNGR